MKKLYFVAAFSLLAMMAQAQLNPVSWTYAAKKIADKTYEVTLTATIQKGWHLYSQTQPDDAIAEPTSFNFTASPLLSFDGKVKEKGKMEKFHDAKLGTSANQYSNKVDFVQVVKLKTAVKTSVVGVLEYQTCDDKKCLPPKKVNFTIALN